jgi:hypothetical protein
VKLVYYTRLLKYVKRSQYKDIDKKFTVISSRDRLKRFVDLGILEQSNDVFKATKESTELLVESGYNKQLLPKIVSGFGNINELNNTDVFIQALHLTDFKFLCYPSFEYLIPDALLVRQKDKQIKFEFLEIEAGKSNWEEYLLRKKKNYIQLSKDVKVFNYCSKICDNLNLPKLKIVIKVKYLFPILKVKP